MTVCMYRDIYTLQPYISVCYSYQVLMRLELCRQIFEKNIQISNFMNIRSVGPK